MSGRHKTAEQYREEGRQQVRKYVESLLDSRLLTMQEEDPDNAVERVGTIVRSLQDQVWDMHKSYSEVVTANQQLRDRLRFWETTFGGLAQTVKNILTGAAEVTRDQPTFQPESVELVGLKDPDQIIRAIKALRAVTGWGVKEAKDVVQLLRDGRDVASPIRREACAVGFRAHHDWYNNAVKILSPHFEVRS